VHTRKLLLPGLALAATGALTVGLPTTAGATSRASASPPGYRVALGPILTVADGAQARSTAHCPKGTVPFGGGLFSDAVSLTAGVNSSFPTANGWTAVINNGSGETAAFQVAVTCARKPVHYSVVKSKPATNSFGRRTAVTVSCPKTAKPLGGGSQSNGSLFVNLAGSRPFQNGWRITEENATATLQIRPAAATTVQAVAVCGSVPNYRLVTGKPRTVQPLSQAILTAACPVGSVVLGGGASINTKVLGVNFNLTAPIDPTAAIVKSDVKSGVTSGVESGSALRPFGWETVINNNNEVTATSAPYAICAGR
jgi:hypothetical protein